MACASSNTSAEGTLTKARSKLHGAVLEAHPPEPGLQLVNFACRRHWHVDDVGE